MKKDCLIGLLFLLSSDMALGNSDPAIGPGEISPAQYFTTAAKIAGLCESLAYLAEFREEDQSEGIEEFRLGFLDFVAERKGLDRDGLLRVCNRAAAEWERMSNEFE